MNFLKRLSRRGFLGSAAVAPVAFQQAEAQPGTYRLTRDVPVDPGFDIIVAGGGPSGAAAAISAARLGAKVLLIEAIGSMGGMGTNAFVSNWYSLNNGEEVMVGGLILELIQKLYK